MICVVFAAHWLLNAFPPVLNSNAVVASGSPLSRLLIWNKENKLSPFKNSVSAHGASYKKGQRSLTNPSQKHQQKKEIQKCKEQK